MQIYTSKTSLKIDTGKVVLEFDTAGKVRFDRLSQPNGINLLDKFNNNMPLWSITFKNRQGKNILIFSDNSQFIKSEINRKGMSQAIINFIWQYQTDDNKKINIITTIRCELGNPVTYWSMSIPKLPKGWNVIRTEFPMIPNIKLKKKSKIAVSHGWGIEDDLKPGYQYEAVYPYCQCVMQFIAIYCQGIGLYLGAHDPNANMKQFYVKADKSKIEFKMTNFAGIHKKPESSYKTPYELAIGVYNGDYYEAAQIYRAFTFKTPWGNPKSITNRKTPDWLKQTVLWLRPKGEEKNTIEVTKKALHYFEVPTALHWNQWHSIP
jgi:hypothetical protein